ncbi:MAG: DUF6077 domain-containing protein [Lachnospiraceae bacterium]|nr:DUF6077 domain-containing protein [Lachnospiraceae bacterium]
MQKTIPEKIIEGSLVVLGLAEAAHLAALFTGQPFHICAQIMAVLFLCAVIFCVAVFFLQKRKTGKGKRPVHENRFLKLFSVYPCLFVLIGLLIVFQIIWNYWLHQPYLTADITGETVQTILASDGLYTQNPMTGAAFTEGMPLRLKILVLPTLYAAICRWTGIPVETLCYSIVPGIVLLLSYLVYSRWAVYLFPGEGKKQAGFLLFTALVYQFGCYSMAMDSSLLFFKGWQGAAIRAGIILPYALLCCLQEKWKSVVLCIFAEACIVWTLYGLGYTVVIAAVVLGIKLVRMAHGRGRL